ncbi:MAG TPA: hotdog domain-containing protein [Myxococcales bacterium]|nr:hotdog domain-containing protein [Myxococcales bacterium]
MADFKSGPRAHLDEWVAPDIADELGFLRAGMILEWMDVVGVLAATRHCRRPVVTASVDGMELRHPIKVGERVTMTAEVAYTSARSLGVSVSMTHGLPTAGTARESVAGYMTFVALDDSGQVAAVPQLQPETPDEIARFDEGRLRREFRNKLENGQLGVPAGAGGPDENKLLIREFLKLLPAFRLPWDRPDKPRQRHLSYVHKIEPIRSSRLNFHGTLYGGTLMRWIETSANLSARAWLGGEPVRLSGLHGLNFIRPVGRHVFIHIRSIVAHAASDSLTVLVNVHAEDPLSDGQEETLRAFLSYAPAREASRVPSLQCEGEEERALFEEVEHRLALHRSLRLEGMAPARAG